MSSIDVEALLKSADAAKANLPSIDVQRPLDPDIVDPGHLLLIESNPFEEKQKKDEEFLRNLARDNAQLLMNTIFKLPTSRQEEVIVVELPPPTFRLPREKPLPKEKPMTKWEKYAKEKGIKKQKKTRLVWDDVVKEWVPRFGMKKAIADKKGNWMMHYKGNAADDDDPFEKAAEEKREKTAKNELQRLRNIARSKNVKVPGVGLTPNLGDKGSVKAPGGGITNTSSDELKRAAELAKKSTASLGKFQRKLPNALEKEDQKNEQRAAGKKRKFQPLVNEGEKEKNLKILERLSSKAPKLDVTKAVGKEMAKEQMERSVEKKQAQKKGKGGRGGKNRQGKAGKGGFGGGGGKGGGGKGKAGGFGGGKGKPSFSKKSGSGKAGGGKRR